MTKYSITVDGGHSAEVEIAIAGESFSGTVASADYGTGAITNGAVAADGSLSGNVSLDGYVADFAAKVEGSAISGNLKYGWFFDKAFTGAETA